MDEQRLGELFRDAVGEAPPASFGPTEVAAASRRATARFRMRMAGAAAVVAVALAGAGVLGGQWLSGGDDQTSTAAGQAERPAERMIEPAPEAAPDAGAPANPNAAPGTACGPADEGLAAELTRVLTERQIPRPGPSQQVPEPCPSGTRSVAVALPGGRLYVLLMPRATSPDGSIARPDGTIGFAAFTVRGAQLVLLSVPERPGQRGPAVEQVPELATELARRL